MNLMMQTFIGVVLGVSATGAFAVDVTVDSGKTHQTIEGFGTCTIGWKKDMSALYRTKAFQDFYVNRMGCSMLRVPLWGMVTGPETTDPAKVRWQDFKYDARGQIYLDFAKAVKKIDPSLRIIGTCWSPPAWMKLNKSLKDRKAGAIRAFDYEGATGRLDPKYLKVYAKWLVEMAKQYKAEGAPFYAISPGNEIQFKEPYESCVWTAEDFCKIVVELRKQLDAAGMKDVLIFGPETMTGHFYKGGTGDYIKAVMADPQARKAVDRWATHGYSDGIEAEFKATSASKLHDAVKDTGKPVWMTEGGTKGHDWPEPIRAGVATALHNGLVAGDFAAFLPWQIVEKTATTHALATVAGPTKKTYAAMHYYKFIRPGAIRLGTNPAFGPVMVSAYLHPKNKTLTVVAINTTDQPQTVNIKLNGLRNVGPLKAWRTSATEDLKPVEAVPVKGGKAVLEMPAESIVTLQGPAAK